MHFALATAALLIVIGLSGLAVHLCRPFSTRLLDQGGSRTASLDGFRGLLALSVVVHHAALARTGALPPLGSSFSANYIAFLGSGPVAYFFMASAYLFGGRLLRDHGRLELVPFAIGRVRRIVPLYLFAVTLAIIVAFYEAGWALQVSPAQLLTDTIKWLSFNFLPRPDYNAVHDTSSMLGPVWTLKFEWMLYFLLPVLAIAQRRFGPSVLLLGLLIPAIRWPQFYFFFTGAASWYLVRLNSELWQKFWFGSGVLGVLATIAIYGESWGIPQAILMLPLFVSVAQGGAISSRFLATATMRFLGLISYSIYLLHVILIHVGTFDIVGARHYAAFDDMSVAAFSTVVGVAVVALSTLTFLFIERPGQKVGRRKRQAEMLDPVAQVP